MVAREHALEFVHRVVDAAHQLWESLLALSSVVSCESSGARRCSGGLGV